MKITIRAAEPVTVWTGREVVGAQPYVPHAYDIRLEDTAAVWALEPECVGGLAGFDDFSCHCLPPYFRFVAVAPRAARRASHCDNEDGSSVVYNSIVLPFALEGAPATGALEPFRRVGLLPRLDNLNCHYLYPFLAPLEKHHLSHVGQIAA